MTDPGRHRHPENRRARRLATRTVLAALALADTGVALAAVAALLGVGAAPRVEARNVAAATVTARTVSTPVAVAADEPLSAPSPAVATETHIRSTPTATRRSTAATAAGNNTVVTPAAITTAPTTTAAATVAPPTQTTEEPTLTAAPTTEPVVTTPPVVTDITAVPTGTQTP